MTDQDDLNNKMNNGQKDVDDTTVDASDKNDDLEDEAQFEEPLASPSVLGEKDASGSTTDAESMDIDEELAKVGIEPERFDKD